MQAPAASQLLALFGRARRFQGGAPVPQLLRGANVALVRPRGWRDARTVLHDAIEALGGRAIVIEFDENALAGDEDLAHTARLFGHLYEAMDCAALAPATVNAFASGAGIPVFCGLGCRCHPLRGLGELWSVEQALKGTGLERRIAFAGDPTGQPASAFLSAALALGFQVRIRPTGRRAGGWPIHVDARQPGDWQLRLGAELLDPHARLTHCTHLVEAVLADALAAR
jgi:ornithine carbamoyltransferase